MNAARIKATVLRATMDMRAACLSLLAACLLQACAGAPPKANPAGWTVTPVLELHDASSEGKSRTAAPLSAIAATASTSASTSASATTATATPAPAQRARARARMEVVQTAAYEYRLQEIHRATAQPEAREGQDGQARQDRPARQDGPAAMRAGTGLQIVNGNGRRGQGRTLKRLMDQLGIGNTALLNQRHFTQRRTVIEYLPGRENEARDVAALLQGPAALCAVARLPGSTAIRLVLGHDRAGTARLADRAQQTWQTRQSSQTRPTLMIAAKE